MPYINGMLRSSYSSKTYVAPHNAMPRIMSENQLIQCRKHFWREKPTKRSGKLSLGEFMNMCSLLEFQLSKRAVNQVFRVADYNDSISCVDFLHIYFKYHLEKQAQTKVEPVHDLSPSKVAYVRSCFFDREKKRHGRLSRVELMEMLYAGGIVMTVEDLGLAFELAESSKDGKILFEEFICLFLKGIKGGDRRTAELEIIARAFSNADTDGNGKLDRTEFRQLLKSIGLDVDARQFSNFFRLADTDRGGSISFEEFQEVCMTRSKFSMKSSDETPIVERIRLSNLPKSHVIKIRELFGTYDVDRNGKLSWSEFRMMTSRSKISDVRLRKAYNIVRNSKCYSLTFQQFINLFPTVEELSLCFGLNLT